MRNQHPLDPNTIVYSLTWFVLLFSYVIVATTVVYILYAENYNGKKLIEAHFFNAGPTNFYVFGVHFKDPLTFYVLNLIFFSNSLFLNVNIAVIQPLFQKITVVDQYEIEFSTRVTLSIIVLIYDVWSAIRSVISLVGVTSNIIFFLSNTMGFLIGDIFIKNLYLKYPHKMNFRYDKPAKVSSTVSAGSLFKFNSPHSLY